MNIPTLRIAVSDNFVSQMYNNCSKARFKHYYGDVNFDLKLNNAACSPSNISTFQKRYPELVLTRKIVRKSTGNTKRDFSITEKCIWYSQYDCWKYVSKQQHNCIILEHDVMPILGKDILWKEIMNYDYHTFAIVPKIPGSKTYLISEIAGYVLSPSFARFAIELCCESWAKNTFCSELNTDGAWNEIVKQGNKTKKFKIMSREEGYTPGVGLTLNDFKPNQSVSQFTSPLIGTTISHI